MTTAKKPDPAKHVTFSLSFDDTERIKAQRHRLSSKERALNASEVVRLALLVLSQEEPAAIDPVLKRLTRFKPGRPTKAKARRR